MLPRITATPTVWSFANQIFAPFAVFGFQLPGFDETVAWLSSLSAIIVLALITITGETVVLASIVVAVSGSWSLPEVVLWLFVGTWLSDAVWFWFAGIAHRRLLATRELGPRQQRVMDWLRRHSGERPYLALLFIKFMYGSRFLMLVYLATRRVSFAKFLLYNGIGTAIWLAVLVPIGIAVSHGLISAADAGRLDVVALIVVAAALLWKGGSLWRAKQAKQATQATEVDPPSLQS